MTTKRFQDLFFSDGNNTYVTFIWEWSKLLGPGEKNNGGSYAFLIFIYTFPSKEIICLWGWQYEAVFTVTPFTGKSILMGPFMSQKTVNMTFFTDNCNQNFFFAGESVYFHSLDCLFNSGSLWQTLFSPFVNILKQNMLIRTHHIFFSKFHMLCTTWKSLSEALWFTAILNNLKIIIFARLKWFLLLINSKQCKVYTYGKNLKKKVLMHLCYCKKAELSRAFPGR